MSILRLGILGTAEIAFRRFLPALKSFSGIEYVGVASRDIRKTEKFIQAYGGRGFQGYEELINDEEIDAVYIPLPPALHYKWASQALKAGKHVLLEKPFTVNLKETNEILKLANKKNLVVHENYMFVYHEQLTKIKKLIEDKEIGDIRQIKINFTFPRRAKNDFRYNKELGGGSLLDCGGYTIKLASLMLGDSSKVLASTFGGIDTNKVDLFGSVMMTNDQGISALLSFGMDNTYRCELIVDGSEGFIATERIFTAPPDLETTITVKKNEIISKINLVPDDQFLKSIKIFYQCTVKDDLRNKNYEDIVKQAQYINEAWNKSKE